MRLIISIIAAIGLGVASAFGAVGASQPWVENYVSNYVAKIVAQEARTINEAGAAGTTYTAGDTTLFVEDAIVPALVAVNIGTRGKLIGLKDKQVFAWTGGTYQSGKYHIETSATNLILRVDGFTYTWRSSISGSCWLWYEPTGEVICEIRQTIIQPSVADMAYKGEL